MRTLEIASDLMETHQSVTDVPLEDLQLPTSQTLHRICLFKTSPAISNRVNILDNILINLSLSVWILKPGLISLFPSTARQQTQLSPTVSISLPNVFYWLRPTYHLQSALTLKSPSHHFFLYVWSEHHTSICVI